MKRIVTVVAKDKNKEVAVEVTARVITPRRTGFTRSEVAQIARGLGRVIADGVRTLPYSNFGPENTVVEL